MLYVLFSSFSSRVGGDESTPRLGVFAELGDADKALLLCLQRALGRHEQEKQDNYTMLQGACTAQPILRPHALGLVLSVAGQ